MKKTTQWIFWAIAAYVLFQFLWWAIYLIHLNEELLNLKLALAPDDQAELSLQSVFERKRAMIVGEGAVFMSLIALGIWKVRKNQREEAKNAKQKENFMLSVTHELKSPLTGIQLAIETISTRKLDPARAQPLLEHALKETQRLNSLTDTILISSRLESNQGFLHNQPISVGPCCKDLIQGWPELDQRERISLKVHNDFTVNGDEQALRAAVRNLIENALKYSDTDTPVDVVVGLGGNTIAVADHGQGIPLNERETIFERFYRIGDERIRTSKGTGLGLFLVKQVADSMKAEITVRDNVPEGSIFTLSFQ